MIAKPIEEAEALDPSETREAQESREENICLHIFTTSATMVGVCLTVLSVFRVLVRQGNVRTAGDTLLGWDALAFLASCFLAYVALRTRNRKTRERMERFADGFFLLALALMAAVCLLLVHELSHEPPRSP